MSTIQELPTVNFDSNPGYDEWRFLHSVYSSEFKYRSQIASRYGIVDSGYDPASAPFTAGRALLVSVSPVNPLTIDITAGQAVTPSHLFIDINASVPSVPLPDLVSGKVYVIAIEYTLVASPQTRINRYGELTEVRLERPSNIPPSGGASTLLNAITIADINDYYNTGLFSDERKSNMVVIAVVNAQSDAVTGQLYLSVDLTRNSYTFNRPWFTVLDVEHRSKIGSGLITDNNPHGIDLQDLSSAGLTLYQQLKPRGGILAKDATYFGYAGKICTELIDMSRWEIDTSGTVTTRIGLPPVGGRYFVRLSKLPVRTGSLYISGKPWQPIPYEWLDGTRILALGSLENPANYSDSLIFEYFTVDALEINAESPTQGLQFVEVKSPSSSKEFIVSGGLAISSLSQTSMSLPSLLGPIKRGYQLLCNNRGSLALSPQPLVATMKVSDIAGTTQTVNQAPLNGAATYLTVGLTGTKDRVIVGNPSNPTAVYDLNLKLFITGVGVDGNPLQETVTFKASQWKDQVAEVNEEEPLQCVRTANKYQLIQSIALGNTLAEPHNAGPEALISIWSDILDASVNQELASIASFFWTGTTGIRVRDERVIGTSFNKLDQKQSRFPSESPDANITATQELLSVLLSPPLSNPQTPAKRLMLELDDDRMWSETWKEFSTTSASGAIQLSSVANVTIGQTIRIAPGKILSIIPPLDTSTPDTKADTSKGKVNITVSDTSGNVFRNNLITTINDPLWDSTWYATLGSGSNPPIILTRADAYPEGFVNNVRKRLYFDTLFTTGTSVSFKINGQPVTTTYATNNDATISAIRKNINDLEGTTGVFASILNEYTVSPFSAIMLHGNVDGDDFTVTDIVSTGPTVKLDEGDKIATSTTFVQPIGGKLPTPHLPQRYPSALQPWTYLSRSIMWEGVWLEAEISLLGNTSNNIANGDTLEVSPNKLIVAKTGTGGADPAKGQFLVAPDSVYNTFTHLAATINNPTFSSGVFAEIPIVSRGLIPSITSGSDTVEDPAALFTDALIGSFLILEGSDPLTIIDVPTATSLQLDGSFTANAMSIPYIIKASKVRVRSGGTAFSASMRVITETVSGKWVLTNVGGVTQYLPKGEARANAFLKTIKPLNTAEWRFMTVEDAALGWSPWLPLMQLSQTAYVFASPMGKSLYQYQLRLTGGSSNGFSLYAYVPETSGATVAALDSRIDILESFMEASTALHSSLNNQVNLLTPEMSESHKSTIYTPATTSLKTRLDLLDSNLYYTMGTLPAATDITPQTIITNAMSGVPARLVSGPTGDFITTSGSTIQVGVIGAVPLVAQIQGYYYSYLRKISLTLPVVGGTASGPYYLYLTKATNWGNSISTGSSAFTKDASSLAGTFPTGTDGVQVGHLLYSNDLSLRIGGKPFVTAITGVTSGSLTLAGLLPATVSSAAYTIYAPREGTIAYTTTKTEDNSRCYLGEVTWTGSTFTPISCYRYLDKWTSDKQWVNASAGTFEYVFSHNLGKIPSSFTLYFYDYVMNGAVSSPIGDAKVLHLGDEVVVKVTTTTMTIRNRYDKLVARTYDGTAKDRGYLQLVI